MHPRDYVRLDEEQFAKLTELLMPGYQLAQTMLAQLNHDRTVAAQKQADAAADAEAKERTTLLNEGNARAIEQRDAEAAAEKDAQLRLAQQEAEDRELAELEAEEAREKAGKKQLSPGAGE